MQYVVLFEDNPDADPGIRAAHMAAHLAFLETNADRISAAGPLATLSGAAAGGLWLAHADDPQDLHRLVKADPFWSTGLRKSVTILRWTRVYADGARLGAR